MVQCHKSVINKSPSDAKITMLPPAAFTAEISGSMQHDMKLSVGGTASIIAILFGAPRRIKPMLWLLRYCLILATTLALGGLIFGAVNVIAWASRQSCLARVDYAVVHSGGARAAGTIHPGNPPRDRPSIFWAAFTRFRLSCFELCGLRPRPTRLACRHWRRHFGLRDDFAFFAVVSARMRAQAKRVESKAR